MTPAKSMEIASLSLDLLKNKSEQKRFTSCVNTAFGLNHVLNWVTIWFIDHFIN